MTIKAGIIGLGVGEKHISGYHSHPECKVVALCDFAEEIRSDVHLKYPDIKMLDDANTILNDPQIDVVSIASYDNYHHEQVLMALKNGKHIFVEKPLCLSEKEAMDIREQLNKTKLRMSSNLILRQSPRFKYVKSMIEKNEFGDVYYLEGDYQYGKIHKLTDGWRGRIDFYSVVFGGGIHLIDLLLWFTNDTIEEVTAYGNRICTKNSQFKYNDMVVGILKFKSGAIAKVASNFGCVRPHFHSLSIYGTKASFVNDLEYGKLYNSRDRNALPDKIHHAYPGTQKGDLIYNFIEAILNKSELYVSEEDVFSAMSVCLAIEKSVNTDKPVSVCYY